MESSSVVVDSSGTTSDDATIRDLTQFMATYNRVSLRDLAWMRIAPWQDVVAQFFDDHALRDDLASINRIEIVTGSQAEALYLGGWLGSRLGWQAAGRTRFHSRTGQPIPLEIVLAGEKRRVRKVTLVSKGSQFIAELGERGDTVALEVTGEKAHPPKYTPLQSVDSKSLIERAILVSGTDEIFETALRMVRDLLG